MKKVTTSRHIQNPTTLCRTILSRLVSKQDLNQTSSELTSLVHAHVALTGMVPPLNLGKSQ